MMLRNGILYLVARLLPGVLSIATMSILTRLLTPAEYGVYGLTLIIMSFGSTIAFEWLGLSFMRLYEARQGDARTIPTFVLLFYAMVGLTLLLMGVVALAQILPASDLPQFAIGICMAWSFACFELLSRFEVAGIRPRRYLAFNLIRAVSLMAFTLGAAWLTHDALATAFGNMLGLLVAIVPLGRRRLAAHPSLFDRELAREVVRFGMPFALSMLLSGLFTSGVRALVAALTDARELGLYTASYALSQNVLFVVAAAISYTTYPLAVRAYEKGDPAVLRAQFEDNLAFLLAIMVPAALGMALAAPELAAHLVGPEFRVGVAPLIPWMALTVLLGSIRGNYLDTAFQLGKRLNRQVGVSAVAAVLALAGTAILVPLLGLIGAPIATLFAMAVSCVHAWLIGRVPFRLPIPARVLRQVGFAAALMSAAVLAVPGGLPYSLAAKIAAGFVGYAAGCLATDLLGLRGMLALGRFRIPKRVAG